MEKDYDDSDFEENKKEDAKNKVEAEKISKDNKIADPFPKIKMRCGRKAMKSGGEVKVGKEPPEQKNVLKEVVKKVGDIKVKDIVKRLPGFALLDDGKKIIKGVKKFNKEYKIQSPVVKRKTSSAEDSFKHGGLVKSGKPKLAKKGWR
jgi:hypothetical protein